MHVKCNQFVFKRFLKDHRRKHCFRLLMFLFSRNSLTLLQDDLSNKNRRCEELGKQNALLHQQMDEMASKSRQVQQQHQQLHLDLSFSEEGKTTEQILEILR